MYHYVRRDSSIYPNFNHLKIEDFEKQLDFFQKKYGFISKEQFLDCVDTGKDLSGVILTFDDGFKDHYENVLPLLKERNICGFFYIPTAHYKKQDKRLLGVHQIHHLKGKYDSKELLDEVMKNVDASMLDENKIKEFDTELYTNMNQSHSDYQFKRLLNYYIKYEFRDTILNELMKKYLNEEEIYKQLYLSLDELKEIEEEGHVIGSHTENHYVLSKLNYEEQRREIEDSFQFLNSFLNLEIKSFCFPYGSRSSFNKDTLKILEKNNVHHAFMFDNAPLNDKNIKNKYFLSRIDCNRF